MNAKRKKIIFHVLVSMALMLTITAVSTAAPYEALKGVKGVKAVFDVSLGSPKVANIVFWAVKNVYEDQSVRALSEPPQAVVVFHGPAVKMLTTDHKDFEDADKEALNAFANTIRQMKQDGVKLEVCMYALKVMGVDPSRVMPEVEIVGNGFISVVGYQARGYSLVTIN